MTQFRRDAALAALCGAVCLWILVAGDAVASLSDPVAVGVGAAVALAVEAAFVLDTPAAAWWERRWVRTVAVAVLVGGVAVAARLVGPLLVAAACWGLVTYFLLLALAVTGRWPFDAAQ